MTGLSTSDLRSDPQSIDELIRAALSVEDENVRWQLVQQLQHRVSEQVFKAAQLLWDLLRKQLCADVLGQFGGVTNSHPEETFDIILSRLRNEPDSDLLNFVLELLWYLDLPPAAAEPILLLKDHRDASVRAAAATLIGKLLGIPAAASAARNTLIEMTSDVYGDVRIAAVSALAFSGPGDKCVRDVLRLCLEDEEEEVRAASFIGLAYENRDPGVVDLLIHELCKVEVPDATLEAAARTADPCLLPILLMIQEHGTRSWWLSEAIDACSGETSKEFDELFTHSFCNPHREKHYVHDVHDLSPEAGPYDISPDSWHCGYDNETGGNRK